MSDLIKLLMVGAVASGTSYAVCWFGELLFGTAGAAIFGGVLIVAALAFADHEFRRLV